MKSLRCGKAWFKQLSGVLIFAGSFLLVFAAAGCGGDTEAETAATAEVKTVTVTKTTTTPAVTPTTTTATETTPAADCPPDGPAGPQPVIASYTVDKATYNLGDTIQFSADIQGDAASVRVIWGSSSGDISSTHDISVMTEQSTSNGVTTWVTSGAATKGSGAPGNLGQCFYRVELVTEDGLLIKAQDNNHYFQVN